MRKIIFILFFILIFLGNLSLISAVCKENQIDINSASKEELKGIIQIGEARAEQMITLRPFSSVDDMIRIIGIGEVYLEAIKSQGLACVNEETETSLEIEDNEEDEIGELDEENLEKDINKNDSFVEDNRPKEFENQIELPVIKLIPLTTKDIKTEENNKTSSKNYAMFGFVVFCILLVFLFILRKNKFKNEFD